MIRIISILRAPGLARSANFMGRQRARRTVKKHSSTSKKDVHSPQEEVHVEKKLHDNSSEVERRVAAVHAIRDAEIENLVFRLHLTRSYLSKEHLEIPAVDFFEKNFPNHSVVLNKDGEFELQRKDKATNFPICLNERNMPTYPSSASILPDDSGMEFSSNAAVTNFLHKANLRIPDFGMEEMSETQLLGLASTLQTPEVTSQRFSVGITPKSQRQPKPGEVLLSVHGSPLGVYKEENMETIQESGEG